MESLIIADWCFPLVMPSICKVSDLDVNRLILFVLWWYRTDAIRDLIARKWNVLAFDTAKKEKKLNHEIFDAVKAKSIMMEKIEFPLE